MPSKASTPRAHSKANEDTPILKHSERHSSRGGQVVSSHPYLPSKSRASSTLSLSKRGGTSWTSIVKESQMLPICFTRMNLRFSKDLSIKTWRSNSTTLVRWTINKFWLNTNQISATSKRYFAFYLETLQQRVARQNKSVLGLHQAVARHARVL